MKACGLVGLGPLQQVGAFACESPSVHSSETRQVLVSNVIPHTIDCRARHSIMHRTYLVSSHLQFVQLDRS